MAVDITDKILSYFTYDLGIDLGTVNTLVYVKGKGIVIREPSAVAQHKKTKKVVAIGREARAMMGKTPASILSIRPLRDGVISDFEVTEEMLKFFIQKVHRTPGLFPPKIPRPRVVVGIPSSVTEVERKAVVDATLRGGARKVYLLEEPMAAAIGANLPVEEAAGSMIVDIGGGTCEIAVISLGGIVNSRSIRIAGEEMDQDIINWAKTQHNLLIGEQTAERVKIEIGQATASGPQKGGKTAVMRGRNLLSGLPQEVEVTSSDIASAIEGTLGQIIINIKQAIEETPPELISDLLQRGIVMVGGGSLLPGIKKLVAEATQMPVMGVEDPMTAVVKGCGKILEDMALLEKVRVIMGG